MDRRLRDRYSRQTMFPRIGEPGQEKLLRSSAVIIGCGALGSHSAMLLMRAGIGKIRIVDRDFVETHNLQRQVLFDEDDVRDQTPKAIAAERRLRKVNSTVQVEGIAADANITNIEGFCRGADVILDGLDNAPTRFLINDAALKHRIPWVYGGAIASTGMTMTIVPGETPCFRCLRPGTGAPATDLTCETAGVLGAAPAIIGALQAMEAIKLLLGAADINRSLTVIDVWSGDWRRLRVKRRADCPACQGRYEFLEEKFQIKTTSLCGQSRAVQVVDSGVRQVSLARLAARLGDSGGVSGDDRLLRFSRGGHEIVVFPDGRAIVRGTTDEALAVALYRKYVAGQQAGA